MRDPPSDTEAGIVCGRFPGHVVDLVARADVPSLARGIALLLGDPARRARCAEAARRIAVDRFSLDHVVERVEVLYRVLAASGPMARKSTAR